jgi:hypothetical protein
MKFHILTLFVLISISKLSAQYEAIGSSFEIIMKYQPETKKIIKHEGRDAILESSRTQYVYYYFNSIGKCNEILMFPKEGYLVYFIMELNNSKEFTKIKDGLWIYTNSIGKIISIQFVKTDDAEGFVVGEADL